MKGYRWLERHKNMYMQHPFSIMACAVWSVLLCTLNCNSSESMATEVLGNLQAANEARSQLEAQKSEWAGEKARLEMFLKLLDDETANCTEETSRINSDIQQIRRESDSMISIVDAYRTLQDAAKLISGKINDSLDARSEVSFPGVVPARDSAADTPESMLENSLSRLKTAKAAAETWNMEIVSGLYGDGDIAVNLLRAGDVAAWWMSLDGTKAGIAYMREGRLVLEDCQDEKILREIARALSVYAGQDVPQWLAMPLPGKKRLWAGGAQ